ncbi:hypothetical protein D3C77_481940 [compost metagenome]
MRPSIVNVFELSSEVINFRNCTTASSFSGDVCLAADQGVWASVTVKPGCTLPSPNVGLAAMPMEGIISSEMDPMSHGPSIIIAVLPMRKLLELTE